jgi:hypothetical protein
MEGTVGRRRFKLEVAIGGELCAMLNMDFRERRLGEVRRIVLRNCLKSLDDRKTKALEAHETGQKGS